LASVVLHAITGVCTPACLLAASIPVETVTPPLVGLVLERATSRLGVARGEVNTQPDNVTSRKGVTFPVGLCLCCRLRLDGNLMSKENKPTDENQDLRQEAWLRLRGALKDVYAEYGGGEAYLRQERESFNRDMERREALIDAASRKK